MAPKSITVKVDSNEKVGHRLLFPDNFVWHESRGGPSDLVTIHVDVCKMGEGDYALAGFEHVVLAETKRSLRELYNNLFTEDHVRALSAFERLAAVTQNPYLILDMSILDLARPTRYIPHPQGVADALMDLATRLNLRVWFTGKHRSPKPRRKVGELLVRMMMAHCYRRLPDEDAINKVLGDINDEAP